LTNKGNCVNHKRPIFGSDKSYNWEDPLGYDSSDDEGFETCEEE
jgi:hypothetical protein